MIGGSEQAVRSTDGVHLLNAGYDLLAGDLVRPMERAWHVNLRVS
jgi:lysophospholipase L1-like esterase